MAGFRVGPASTPEFIKNGAIPSWQDQGCSDKGAGVKQGGKSGLTSGLLVGHRPQGPRRAVKADPQCPEEL